MPKAHAKVKTTRSSKQAKQKLVAMMRDLEKTTTKQPSSKTARGTCARIYCV
jgi:phenylpyruvate tautomerase PptA (4-oxalocrotonate tautomerase family)